MSDFYFTIKKPKSLGYFFFYLLYYGIKTDILNFIYIYKCMCVYIYILVYVYIYISVYVCVCVYIYIYIYIYISGRELL